MCFSSLTRAIDRTAAACNLQTQAGALAGQAAQSAVQRSPLSVTHIMGYYSFNRPRRNGRLSWLCWLTDSGRRTHKVVKQPSISLAQDKESLPARTDVLTTMLRHQFAVTGFAKLAALDVMKWNDVLCVQSCTEHSDIAEDGPRWHCKVSRFLFPMWTLVLTGQATRGWADICFHQPAPLRYISYKVIVLTWFCDIGEWFSVICCFINIVGVLL